MAQMDEHTSRSVWIGWRSSIVFLGLAILTGGVVWAYLCVFLGIVIALRGHFPSWFKKRIEAQLIAGIPGRDAVSFKKWIAWVLLVVILGASSSLIHRRMWPEKTPNGDEQIPLQPSNKPEPRLQTGPIPDEILRKMKETGLNIDSKQLEDQGREFIERGISRIPTTALRIYLGNSILGYTSKKQQVVLVVSGRKLVSVQRAADGGLLIYADIYGADNRIIAGISSNVFYPNKGRSDYWRYERTDISTLAVFDQLGDKALSVEYLRPRVVRIIGKFQYSGVTVLASEAGLSVNGKPWLQSVISGDNEGALFATQ